MTLCDCVVLVVKISRESITDVWKCSSSLLFVVPYSACKPKIISLSIYYSCSNKNCSTSCKLVICHHSVAAVVVLRLGTLFLLFMVLLQVLSKGIPWMYHLRHPWETHSRPQRQRSFWSAPRIATSGSVQQQKSAIHGLPVTLRMLRVKSDKSDWLRIRNNYSVHAQKIWPSQRLRFLVLTKRSTAPGDENVWDLARAATWTHWTSHTHIAWQTVYWLHCT